MSRKQNGLHWGVRAMWLVYSEERPHESPLGSVERTEQSKILLLVRLVFGEEKADWVTHWLAHNCLHICPWSWEGTQSLILTI